ncbi:hypothetical protein AVEN_16591-1 [Araneus ventricosus]|uniref:Uncharacterized protein n=1 Tax=Araneus ventricosus TaxID=182803 RepID=A0A4Y2VAD3_ARAVE|nr:hypothetical protein AVEN_16591-1 [Araneus ventricosus]
MTDDEIKMAVLTSGHNENECDSQEEASTDEKSVALNDMLKNMVSVIKGLEERNIISIRLDWVRMRKRQRRCQGNHLPLPCDSRVCSEDVCTCALNCDVRTYTVTSELRHLYWFNRHLREISPLISRR